MQHCTTIHHTPAICRENIYDKQQCIHHNQQQQQQTNQNTSRKEKQTKGRIVVAEMALTSTRSATSSYQIHNNTPDTTIIATAMFGTNNSINSNRQPH
eukprot:344935-Ditylum_brightwellii.AAC.1